jgi:uncharacterized DUF497 family protein
MRLFEWDEEKNSWLKSNRNVCFEDVVFCVENGFILDDKVHPNQNKYPNQRLMIIDMDGYAYLVPYIENEESLFLKTIIPSRKAFKQYLGDTL